MAPARLDVGGDAAALLLVAQCDDTTAGRPVWSVLTSGPDAWRRDEVSVRVARLDGHLPYGSLTPVGPATAALETFLLTGGRAPDLPWRTDRDAEDLRSVFTLLD